jgi:hypothetical protein
LFCIRFRRPSIHASFNSPQFQILRDGAHSPNPFFAHSYPSWKNYTPSGAVHPLPVRYPRALRRPLTQGGNNLFLARKKRLVSSTMYRVEKYPVWER